MQARRNRPAIGAVCLMTMLAGAVANAHNLQLANVTVSPRDASTAYVTFDLSWDHSWRDAAVNHDAAWVFFKAQKVGETDWRPVTLEGTGTNPADFDVGVGTLIELVVPADPVGLFVRRVSDGSGSVTVTGIQAVWDFTASGLVEDDQAKLQAFGVEMVHVPAGAFMAGNTGGVIDNSFRDQTISTSPFSISSENAVTIYYGSGPSSAAMPAAFPKGYAGFYCMKYEVTQAQYRDFLNTLTRDQQAARFASTTVGDYLHSGSGQTSPVNRNGLRLVADPGGGDPRVYACDLNPSGALPGGVDELDDGLDIACAWLSAADIFALTDWAGLRPMTELEFEKACRGTVAAVASEYAWGTADNAGTTSTGDGYELHNAGQHDEYVTWVGGNGPDATHGNISARWTVGTESVNNINGPLRVGIFAGASSDRVAAGASYWGIMNLSGNVFELCFSVVNGLAFTGLHGDGALDVTGDADVANWPTGGLGGRGVGWSTLLTRGRVANRFYATSVTGANRENHIAGRAVRTEP